MKRFYLFLTIVFLGLSCMRINKQTQMTEKIEIKLNEALNRFEPNNSGFLFSIFQNDTCILQIVHRSFSEITRNPNNEFGFAINLTFDPTFPKEIEFQKKFANMDISKSFIYYDWEGIPCYIKDFDKDIKNIAKVTSFLLTDLYGFKNDSTFDIDLIDQGQIK